MATTITIPPIEEYRIHLRMVLSYMLAHFIGTPDGEKPPIDFRGMITEEAINKLMDKLAKAKPAKSLKITIGDILLLYTSFVLMNKILVSDYDEIIATPLLKLLPDDHPLKQFNDFRDEMISINNHLITNAEEKLHTQKRIALLKERLAEVEIG